MKVNTTQGALERLKAARDADYLQPWEPGKPRTDNELIWEYIVKLQDRLSLGRDEAFLNNYRPGELQGDGFRQDEIDNVNNWR